MGSGSCSGRLHRVWRGTGGQSGRQKAAAYIGVCRVGLGGAAAPSVGHDTAPSAASPTAAHLQLLLQHIAASSVSMCLSVIGDCSSASLGLTTFRSEISQLKLRVVPLGAVSGSFQSRAVVSGWAFLRSCSGHPESPSRLVRRLVTSCVTSARPMAAAEGGDARVVMKLVRGKFNGLLRLSTRLSQKRKRGQV